MTTLASGSSVTFGLAVDQTFEMTFADGTTGTITVTGTLGSPYRTTFGPAKKNNWTPLPLGTTGRVIVACTAGDVSYTLGTSSFLTAVTDALVFRPQYFDPSAGLTNLVGDDTVALQSAIAAAVAVNGAVDLGSGKYRITAPLGVLITAPITIFGVSPADTWISVDPSMSGDVVSFKNTWYGTDVTNIYGGGTSNGGNPHSVNWPSVLSRKSGVQLSNFSIVGDRGTAQTQNGIMFYDRNDAVKITNVEVEFIRGTALGLSGSPSVPATLTACLLRESNITDFQARNCGDAITARPSVVLNCNSRTAAQNGGVIATIADDANNYNVIRGMKVIFSDGLSFQSNCYNINDTLGSANCSNNWIELIVDSQHSPETTVGYVKGGMTNAGYAAIANGVLTISAGVSFTKLDGSGSGELDVGTYLLNGYVPSGTYVSAILTGTGGVGTYQLANKNIDLSAFTVAAGTLGACRYSTPCIQLGGGHLYERFDFTLNQSNLLGSNSVGVEFNQNILNTNTSKCSQSKMVLSTGQIDVALFFTVIASLDVKWLARASAATAVTALTVSQNVTLDLLDFVVGHELSGIGGPKTNIHVYPGGQKVITAASIASVMTASKWPNCEMLLNNGDVLTRWYSNPATDVWELADAESILARAAIPMILPSSGTMGANGALTGLTALPYGTFPQSCYMYFPAGKVYAGSVAGMYYASITSTTAATVYNNIYTSGTPTVPASPTAVVDAGPGAYTQTTAADIALVDYTVPGGVMGTKGALQVTQWGNHNNSGNNKIYKAFLGGTAAGNLLASGTQTASASFIGTTCLRNRNSASVNLRVAGGSGATSFGVLGYGSSSAACDRTAIDTSIDQSMKITAQMATATDYVIIEAFVIKVLR